MIWLAKIKKIIDTEKKQGKIKKMKNFLLYLQSKGKYNWLQIY